VWETFPPLGLGRSAGLASCDPAPNPSSAGPRFRIALVDRQTYGRFDIGPHGATLTVGSDCMTASSMSAVSIGALTFTSTNASNGAMQAQLAGGSTVVERMARQAR
jgi:hypothetical protein